MAVAVGCVTPLPGPGHAPVSLTATAPIILDQNRMLVDAELQGKDGQWRKARLWVDTGNPEFFMSESLAQALGVALPTAQAGQEGTPVPPLEIPPPSGVRIGGMALDFSGVKSRVLLSLPWLLRTMHADGNLPSTVLKRYHVVFDYPKGRLLMGRPGSFTPRGERVPADVHPETGIVQMEAFIGGERLSLALDNGASYSFLPEEVLSRLSRGHPEWPRGTGAIGCANIWGWWPGESAWPMLRASEIRWGTVPLGHVGLVGLPSFFPNGMDLGAWYSLKTAKPVAGFLGPNAFRSYRVEIDYAGGAVYFEKGAEEVPCDLDLVGLTVQPQADGGYAVIGIAVVDGKPGVMGIEAGDALIRIGGLAVNGAMMGAVVDALRGTPGEVRILEIEHAGKPARIEAKVERHLCNQASATMDIP